jgi:hypothetical protein
LILFMGYFSDFYKFFKLKWHRSSAC